MSMGLVLFVTLLGGTALYLGVFLAGRLLAHRWQARRVGVIAARVGELLAAERAAVTGSTSVAGSTAATGRHHLSITGRRHLREERGA